MSSFMSEIHYNIGPTTEGIFNYAIITYKLLDSSLYVMSQTSKVLLNLAKYLKNLPICFFFLINLVKTNP